VKAQLSEDFRGKSLDYKIGQIVNGFKVLEKRDVKELRCRVWSFEHEKTGARALHLEAADDENVFSVILPTRPLDSTGVAHILEHTTLCGSIRYPVRDPFFNMLNRSINTFMNAFTGSDFTMYPFATQNFQDFQNLLSVYLDAVFFPRLTEFDFKQEAHRLEFKDAEKMEELEYKGVVYNEMKGVMSDGSEKFMRSVSKYLYPTTTYHYNSGGDPSDIPSLTYQQLIDFHHNNYHPSNATFVTYGDMGVEHTFEMIHSMIQNFERIDRKKHIPLEQRYTEPQSFTISGPLSPGLPEDKQCRVAVSYLLADAADFGVNFELSIISSLLMEGPNSPLYKSLIASNIGMSYTPPAGFDPNSRETSFTVGLAGISQEQIPQVESVILNTLQEVVQQGFEQKKNRCSPPSSRNSFQRGTKDVWTFTGADGLTCCLTLQ